MINAEIHKNELRTLFKLNKLQDCALRKDNGSFGNCYNIFCKNCVFDDKEGCTYARIKWMLSECEEPIKLTRLEYDILKYLSDNTKYMYIVRDGNGNIFLYDEEPQKSESAPWWTGRGMCHTSMFNKLFQFVQWEDSTPTLIKDVLENCEVVEDESNE